MGAGLLFPIFESLRDMRRAAKETNAGARFGGGFGVPQLLP